jgi:hypothetical protein
LAAPDIIFGLDESLELMATAGGGTLGRTCEEIQLKKKRMVSEHICAKIIDARVEPSGIAHVRST